MRDLIVVGAGPAGNMAALNLSRMGYSVSVLDWRKNIGDKLCTGIIGTECAKRFPPHDAHIYHKATAATLVSPSGKRYSVVRKEPQALIVDRVAYVDSLAQQAMAAGAEYHLGSRVTNIDVSTHSVSIKATSDMGEQQYQTKVIIIAGGFGSSLLNMVGLQNRGNGDYMLGSQAEVVVTESQNTEVYLGDEIAPGSFGWLVPTSDHKALAGIASHRQLNGQVDRFLSTLQSIGKVRSVVNKPQRWGIPLKPLHRTYSHRTLVVGDAAGLAKPTTGGGIYYALLSGELAAEAANEALTAGDLSARRLSGYEKAWKALFGRELRIGHYARMLYETLGNREVERLLDISMRIQDDLINSHDFSFDWHSGVILKALRHRDLGWMIRSFGPLVAPLLSQLIKIPSLPTVPAKRGSRPTAHRSR